jgi:hypothetical protein
MRIFLIKKSFLIFLMICGLLCIFCCKDLVEPTKKTEKEDPELNITLKSTIEKVLPMTGIVFWTDSKHNASETIQLEYSYMLYNDIVKNRGVYNWGKLENLLKVVESRKHQAVIRFRFTYPGEKTSVPEYIKQSPGYHETRGLSEGEITWFPDWSFMELKDFTLEFYSKFAEQYDDDPRISFLQVGFGLWAEYHIYDGPMILGKTFPSKNFQKKFLKHLEMSFNDLHWSISIDSADETVSPFKENPDLLEINFGLFDDSFLHKTHHDYNAECFFFLGSERYQTSPIGGELSYYSAYDQRHALDRTGPYGISFEELSKQYHISYMIGNDQPDFQSMSRIKEVGLAIGYKFKIISFKASSIISRVVVQNTGIAPIYYDAFITVNGVRSEDSLKGLLPGEEKEYIVAAGGKNPVLVIESNRLVSGQIIQFEADL